MSAIPFSELNLSTPLLNALNDLGYTHATTIQGRAFSVVMSGRDVVGIAQTGTGKTFAYLLPCLRQWKFSKEKSTQVLILVPTRELVVQVLEEIQKLSKYMSVTAIGVYGGTNINTQIGQVMELPDFVVATPGRLIDLILKGAFKSKTVKKLVIDEVDEMLALGFRAQLKLILDLLPLKRQNIMFSATLTAEVESMIDEFFNQPVKVEAAPSGSPLTNIEQTLYEVPNFYTKVNLLKLLLKDETMTKVLVFCATKQLADEVFDALYPMIEESLGIIHSNKSQNFRFEAVRRFHSGECRVLVATDVVARGIDVSEVSHVFNFDLPETPENYIHRIGRTGRADKKGIAIAFCTPREEEMRLQIELLMDYTIPVVPLPDELEISTQLTRDEIPKVYQPNLELKAPRKGPSGAAFHEKSEKNSKTPGPKITRAQKLREKYGKPKTKRGGKK